MITEVKCTFCKKVIKLLKPYRLSTLPQEVGHDECAQAAMQKLADGNMRLGYNPSGTSKV